MNQPLSVLEKANLLRLARSSLENAVRGQTLAVLDEKILTPALRAQAASFVTLSIQGNLRGCIGALQAYQPLAEDVREHAIAAGLEDYRFPPVSRAELAHIHIEISRLSNPTTLVYSDEQDLLTKLRPGVDGVILRDGRRRATFLPQVWGQITAKEEFLGHLCVKMGADANLWRRKHLDVQIYQVEEFEEPD